MKYSIFELDKIKEILQDRIHGENGRQVPHLGDVYYGHSRVSLQLTVKEYDKLFLMARKHRKALQKIEEYFAEATDDFINTELK